MRVQPGTIRLKIDMRDTVDGIAAAEHVSWRERVNREVLSGAVAVDDLKKKSVRGGAATILGQGIGMVLQIGTTVVLARLLSPTDYGLQSMVITLTAFLSLFKDAGLNAVTIQRESLTHQQISTLFWINAALGVILTGIVAAAGPFVAEFYKEPRILWLTVASSSIFLFNSLTIQHQALLDRAMRFSTTVKINMLSATIGSLVAILMAALGGGYWSLICQNITIPLIAMIATWIAMPWIPGRPRWTPEMRPMMRFGSMLTLNGLVVYVAYNTEKILLGRVWGPAALGIYGRAFQLTNLPVQQLTGAVSSVAFPMLSRLQSDGQRLKRSYLKAHSLIVTLTVPVVVSCVLFADGIVQIVLGPKWIDSVMVLRLLAPTVLVFALVNPLDWILRATGRVARGLKIAILIAPVVILGVLSGLHYGPRGVAAGYSCAMILLAVPIVVWAIHGTGITILDYVGCVKPSLLAGLVAGVTGWLVRFASHGMLPPKSMLAPGMTISMGTYAVMLFFVLGQKDLILEVLKQLLSKKQNSRLVTEA